MTDLMENAEIIAKVAETRFRDGGGRRVIIAIAGPPGSGKSTLSEAVVERLNRTRPVTRRSFRRTAITMTISC